MFDCADEPSGSNKSIVQQVGTQEASMIMPDDPSGWGRACLPCLWQIVQAFFVRVMSRGYYKPEPQQRIDRLDRRCTAALRYYRIWMSPGGTFCARLPCSAQGWMVRDGTRDERCLQTSCSPRTLRVTLVVRRYSYVHCPLEQV